MNYLDYIIIAIFIFYGLWGLAKGLIRILFDVVGYIVAIFAAKFLSPFLIDYLNGTSLYGSIHNRIFETFSKINTGIGRSVETITIPENMSSLLDKEPGLRSVMSSYPKLQSALESNISALNGRVFMEVITEYIIAIIALVAIFLLVKILFSIIVSIVLSSQDQMPLALTNRVLGMTLGCIIALFIVTFSLQLLEASSLASSPMILETISSSKYGHVFTSLPLLEFLSKMIQ